VGVRPGSYLITGISCSGKTTVIKELAGRNFNAYSTDEMPEVSGFFDRLTGSFLPIGEQPSLDPTESVDFSRFGWFWRPDGLAELLGESSASTNFIGASVMNQYKAEVASFFDKTFVLLVDEETLRQRIVKRANDPDSINKYGARPEEMERILSLRDQRQQQALAYGAIPITAAAPVVEVANEILSHIQA